MNYKFCIAYSFVYNKEFNSEKSDNNVVQDLLNTLLKLNYNYEPKLFNNLTLCSSESSKILRSIEVGQNKDTIIAIVNNCDCK